MSTKELSRKDLIDQSFSCCIQVVKSYGPHLEERHRQGLINCMEHFKNVYTSAVEKE